jgi:hypothetical protein
LFATLHWREDLAAPEIIDLEVASVWRRTLKAERRAQLALADLAELPLARAGGLRCAIEVLSSTSQA